MICNELGISRSTGYNYIDQYITASTYPQVIQDAAADGGLNLALPHVQAVFSGMQAEGLIPDKPNALELEGIISKLEAAKPERKPKVRGTAREHFQKLLTEAFKYAKKSKLEVTVIEQAFEAELNAIGFKTTFQD